MLDIQKLSLQHFMTMHNDKEVWPVISMCKLHLSFVKNYLKILLEEYRKSSNLFSLQRPHIICKVLDTLQAFLSVEIRA